MRKEISPIPPSDVNGRPPRTAATPTPVCVFSFRRAISVPGSRRPISRVEARGQDSPIINWTPRRAGPHPPGRVWAREGAPAALRLPARFHGVPVARLESGVSGRSGSVGGDPPAPVMVGRGAGPPYPRPTPALCRWLERSARVSCPGLPFRFYRSTRSARGAAPPRGRRGARPPDPGRCRIPDEHQALRHLSPFERLDTAERPRGDRRRRRGAHRRRELARARL